MRQGGARRSLAATNRARASRSLIRRALRRPRSARILLRRGSNERSCVRNPHRAPGRVRARQLHVPPTRDTRTWNEEHAAQRSRAPSMTRGDATPAGAPRGLCAATTRARKALLVPTRAPRCKRHRGGDASARSLLRDITMNAPSASIGAMGLENPAPFSRRVLDIDAAVVLDEVDQGNSRATALASAPRRRRRYLRRRR